MDSEESQVSKPDAEKSQCFVNRNDDIWVETK